MILSYDKCIQWLAKIKKADAQSSQTQKQTWFAFTVRAAGLGLATSSVRQTASDQANSMTLMVVLNLNLLLFHCRCSRNRDVQREIVQNRDFFNRVSGIKNGAQCPGGVHGQQTHCHARTTAGTNQNLLSRYSLNIEFLCKNQLFNEEVLRS